jgi:hypothetical protein
VRCINTLTQPVLSTLGSTAATSSTQSGISSRTGISTTKRTSARLWSIGKEGLPTETVPKFRVDMERKTAEE